MGLFGHRRPASGGDRTCCRHPLRLERLAADEALVEANRAAIRQTLERLAAVPGRPQAMAPFADLLGGTWRLEEIERSGRPVVGTFCNFVPEELVLAAGGVPLRLDLGLAGAAQAGARVLTTDVCPAVRSIVGAHLGQLPYFRRADLLVVPTACDGKKKVARILADEREVLVMELPQSKEGERARAHWLEEVRALARRLERLTGRSINRGALREAIQLLNRRTVILRRLIALRQERPGALGGRDALLVMQASFIADPAWWTERTTALVEELERQPAVDREPVRLLLTGSPVLFPDFRVLDVIEEAGAVIVADEMCSGTQRLYNPTVVDEWTVGSMLRAVAERTLLPCTCPCFVGSDDRIDRLLELASSSRAQGVIHHTLRLCQLYDLELPRVGAALRERGLPLLNIYTEHGGEEAVIRNRVEAFLEMLQQ